MDLKAILFKIVVKMLASTFLTFAVVFITVSVAVLLIQLVPCLIRGVIDIEPLPILLVPISLALLAAGLRIMIMRRFSKVRI